MLLCVVRVLVHLLTYANMWGRGILLVQQMPTCRQATFWFNIASTLFDMVWQHAANMLPNMLPTCCPNKHMYLDPILTFHNPAFPAKLRRHHLRGIEENCLSRTSADRPQVAIETMVGVDHGFCVSSVWVFFFCNLQRKRLNEFTVFPEGVFSPAKITRPRLCLNQS